MPRVEDLVELRFSSIDAKHLGFVTDGVEGVFSALSALGNNSQANAYQIIGNVNQFTTVTAVLNSVKLPLARTSANGQIIIKNADSADSINLFPGVGDSINELAANTAITILAGVTVICNRINDTKWIITSGTAGGTSSGTNTGDVTLAGTPNYITIAGQVITRALINLTSHVTGVLPSANGGTGGNFAFASGTYTPTLVGIANVSAATPYLSQYLRVGNTVTVSGKVDIDPTAASSLTQMRLSLPIASNFGNEQDCGGVAFSNLIAGLGASIRADAVNDTAFIEYVNQADIANRSYFYTFTYRII